MLKQIKINICVLQLIFKIQKKVIIEFVQIQLNGHRLYTITTIPNFKKFGSQNVTSISKQMPIFQ